MAMVPDAGEQGASMSMRAVLAACGEIQYRDDLVGVDVDVEVANGRDGKLTRPAPFLVNSPIGSGWLGRLPNVRLMCDGEPADGHEGAGGLDSRRFQPNLCDAARPRSWPCDRRVRLNN
jgi:hypothetical protein